MRLSYAVGTGGFGAPPGLPVSLTELRSGQVLGYYPNVGAAAEHRRVLESAYLGGGTDLDDPDDSDDDDGEDLPADMVEPDDEAEERGRHEAFRDAESVRREPVTDNEEVVLALQEVLATPGLTDTDRRRLNQLIEINRRGRNYHPFRARAAAYGSVAEAKAIVTTTLDRLHRIRSDG